MAGASTEQDYIFLTDEGSTYQPGSQSSEPDIENCQLLGIARGQGPKEAFARLVAENTFLLTTSFDRVYCYPLAAEYLIRRSEFSLTELRAASSQTDRVPA